MRSQPLSSPRRITNSVWLTAYSRLSKLVRRVAATAAAENRKPRIQKGINETGSEGTTLKILTEMNGRNFVVLASYVSANMSAKQNGHPKMTVKLLIIKVGAKGFEPSTSRSRTERSTRLSHAPKTILTRINYCLNEGAS